MNESNIFDMCCSQRVDEKHKHTKVSNVHDKCAKLVKQHMVKRITGTIH